MKVEIDIPAVDPIEANAKKIAMEKIARAFDKELLQSIAELTGRPQINSKLKNLLKHPMAKTFI